MVENDANEDEDNQKEEVGDTADNAVLLPNRIVRNDEERTSILDTNRRLPNIYALLDKDRS